LIGAFVNFIPCSEFLSLTNIAAPAQQHSQPTGTSWSSSGHSWLL
jgi:hypothetical protein